MNFVRPVLQNSPGLPRMAQAGDGELMPIISLPGDAAVTLTVAALLGGYIAGVVTAGRAYTLPLAADVIAAQPGMEIGESFTCVLAASGGTVTITTNTGWTVTAITAAAVATATSRNLVITKTSATTMTCTIM